MFGKKRCPYCAEKISTKAKKCKHCGEFLGKETKVARAADEPKRVVVEHQQGRLMNTLIVLAIIAIIVAVLGL